MLADLERRSTRQYEHRIYKIWNARAPNFAATRPLPLSAGTRAPLSPRGLQPPLPLRRRRPAQSTHSTSSAEFTLSRPPRKKHQTELPGHYANRSAQIVDGEFHGTRANVDATAGPLDLVLSSGSFADSWGAREIDSPRTLVGEPSPSFISAGHNSEGTGSHGNQWLTDSPRTLVDEPRSRLNSTAAGLSPFSKLSCDDSTATARKKLEPESGVCSGFSWSPRTPPMGVVGMANTVEGVDRESGVRVIRHGQLAETLAPRDMLDINLAADFLSAIGCNKDAFELYTTLLKRYYLDPSFRNLNFWYIIIQCAYTAATLQHMEIVQHILGQELRRFQDANIVSDHPGRVVLQRLSALLRGKISTLNNETPETTTRARRPRTENNGPSFISMLGYLPPDDRSLDLLLYHSALARHAGEGVDVLSPTPWDFTAYALQPTECQFETGILGHRPGPFELDHGVAANPCLRACLRWCTDRLEAVVEVPPTPGVEVLCTDTMTISWTEATALFFVLWKQFIKESGASLRNGSQVWIGETQRRMGISPTMLLMLVCRVICNEDDDGPARENYPCELRHRLQQIATKFLTKTDRQVARRFLRQYVIHHTLTDQPRWRDQMQRSERSRAIACLGGTLGVSFSGLDALADAEDTDVLPDAPPAVTDTQLDTPTGHDEPFSLLTIASSERGSRSSYRTFQEASNRAANGVKNQAAGRFSGPSTPSRYLRRPGSLTSNPRASDNSIISNDLIRDMFMRSRDSEQSSAQFAGQN